jgi:hypothetical protein
VEIRSALDGHLVDIVRVNWISTPTP